jgi:uncharacterized membrane protein
MRVVLSVLLALLFVGCKAPSKISCEGAPLVTYNNFGKGFMTRECQVCHAQSVTGETRLGAPKEFFYDTPERVWEDADLILLSSTGNDPIMPPSDGVFSEDRLRLEIWLRCGQNGAVDGVQVEQVEAP